MVVSYLTEDCSRDCPGSCPASALLLALGFGATFGGVPGSAKEVWRLNFNLRRELWMLTAEVWCLAGRKLFLFDLFI